MASFRKQTHRRAIMRPLLATALAIGGVFNLVSVVLANGTAAGTQINNTATATYNDPNDPSNPITSTSNTVTITVAEVAGITVAASGTNIVVDNGTTGSVDAGDAISYQFTVTNVGNDTTNFRIPDSVDITGPGTLTDPDGAGAANPRTPIEVSYDGGVTWVVVPPGGLETTPIPPQGSVLVRAYVAVNTTNVQAGDPITVQLGNTPGDGQNQEFISDGGDVFTVDSPDGTAGEVNGAPVNGDREASATQSATVGSTVQTQALVTLEKVMSDYQQNNTLTTIEDDRITYDLSFTVEDQPPAGSTFSPGPLLPQGGIEVRTTAAPATPAAYILVSDAIPAGTTFVSSTAPAGWTPVYTNDTLGVNEDATNLIWHLDINNAGGAAGVTRVGFINGNTINSVSPGATVGTFRITVGIEDRTPDPTSLVIANIAQVFGSNTPTTTPAVNDKTNLVVDESGDQTPSNYNSTGATFDPPSDGELPDNNTNGTTDGNPDGIPDDIDPNNPTSGFGTDPSNNNTGSGDGGEANILTLSVAPTNGVLNGPDNFPGATGPTDNNDDFTNKSVNVPDTTPGNTNNDPSPVNFTNTIQNSGTTAGTILLLPTPPTDPTELPTGTIVTIIGPTGTGTATYEWSGTAFTDVNGNPPTIFVVVPDVPTNESRDYGVQIDLPAGTSLSTDADIANGDEPGFPVPITALVDTSTPRDGDPTAVDFSNPTAPVLGNYEGFNTTINRVYTGFLRLLKESRILQGTGPAVAAGQGDFTTTPGVGDPGDDVARIPSPGNIIEYRVTYSNISEPISGTNNVILRAANVVLTEDGTVGGANGNNWALDTDSNSILDTSNVINSATDSRGGGIQYFNGATGTNPGTDQSGTTAATDVTRYVDTVPGQIDPGESGTFTFQRRLN